MGEPKKTFKALCTLFLAIELVESNIDVGDLEFVHGHFDLGDLIRTKAGQVVLFSNLFWSWRVPR